MQALISSIGVNEKVYIASDVNKLTTFAKSAIRLVISEWKDFSKVSEASLMQEALDQGDLETCLEFFNDLTAKYNKPFYIRLAQAFIAPDA